MDPTNQNGRNAEIDGIRGWAALIVVIFHFFQETFGKVFPQLHAPPFGFIFDGRLMVMIFFVLSGDALSVSFFRSGNTFTTNRIIIGRYFRLTFPVVVSCIIVYILMVLGLTWNIEASKIVHREDWLGTFIDFKPTLMELMRYAVGDVYFNGGHSYNPFLWTIPIEMLGSIIIFVNIYVHRKIRAPLHALIIQFVFFYAFDYFYSLFIFGMILGLLRSKGMLLKINNSKRNWVGLLAFILCLIFISVFGENQIKYHNHHISGVIQIERLHTLWAMMIVFLAYCSSFLVRFFSSKISHFLGGISFPLYIMQFTVLVSITSYGIILLNRFGLIHTYWSLLLSSVSVVVSIFLAIIFRDIERRFLSTMNRLISEKILIKRV